MTSYDWQTVKSNNKSLWFYYCILLHAIYRSCLWESKWIFVLFVIVLHSISIWIFTWICSFFLFVQDFQTPFPTLLSLIFFQYNQLRLRQWSQCTKIFGKRRDVVVVSSFKTTVWKCKNFSVTQIFTWNQFQKHQNACYEKFRSSEFWFFMNFCTFRRL